MKTLNEIQRQLTLGQFEFSWHAFGRAVERNISDDEIRHAGKQAVLIEDYPDDKYSPSVLLLGFTRQGRPLHFHVSSAETPLAKIITLYEPDEFEWMDDFSRRK
jgi:hypothetical protein